VALVSIWRSRVGLLRHCVVRTRNNTVGTVLDLYCCAHSTKGPTAFNQIAKKIHEIEKLRNHCYRAFSLTMVFGILPFISSQYCDRNVDLLQITGIFLKLLMETFSESSLSFCRMKHFVQKFVSLNNI